QARRAHLSAGKDTQRPQKRCRQVMPMPGESSCHIPRSSPPSHSELRAKTSTAFVVVGNASVNKSAAVTTPRVGTNHPQAAVAMDLRERCYLRGRPRL